MDVLHNPPRRFADGRMNKVRRLTQIHVFALLQREMRHMIRLVYFDDLEDAMGDPHGPQRQVQSADFEEWQEDVKAELEPEDCFELLVDFGGAMGPHRDPQRLT